MRILSGYYKGLLLKTPPGQTTRPTLSRIKEALFNILNHHLSGSFLELYAGSGNIGIEAFSRGCQNVVLVEKNVQANKYIAHNLAKLKNISGSIRLVRSDALAYCQKILGEMKFDYIFLDPPYEQIYYDVWEKNIRLNNLLCDKGKIILQHSSKTSLPKTWSGAKLEDKRQYGETTLSFYRHDEVTNEK